MERPLVLYYNAFSFFSQKVRLCLAEKGLQYTHVKIDLPANENYSPWFMRKNPKGQVPVLQHGDKYIPDSLAIIKYLDDNFAYTGRLTPNPSTEQGVLIQEICDICRAVFIPMVTFFIQRYPDMVQDSLIPEMVRTLMLKKLGNPKILAKEFVRKAEKYPDLREAYLAKKDDTKPLKQFAEDPNFRQRVKEQVKRCITVFDMVEKQLKSNAEAGQADNWLCGENFTLADIEVGVLMQRLRVSGVAKSTWKNGNYPNTGMYFNKICERKTFRDCSYNVGPTSEVATTHL